MINALNTFFNNLKTKSNNYNGIKKLLLIICFNLFTIIKMILLVIHLIIKYIPKVFYFLKSLIGMTEEEVDELTSHKRIFQAGFLFFILFSFPFDFISNGIHLIIAVISILALYIIAERFHSLIFSGYFD